MYKLKVDNQNNLERTMKLKNLPKMISTKDLMYICDMFNWHLVAAKKMDSYALQVNDKECIKKINELATLHYQTCEDLIKFLESEAK